MLGTHILPRAATLLTELFIRRRESKACVWGGGDISSFVLLFPLLSDFLGQHS